MRGRTRAVLVALGLVAVALFASTSASAKYRVTTMGGFAAPGTPPELNKVQVLKQGREKADHVLVLVTGTSGGAAYFRPLASSIIDQLPDYQVWSVERRENLLEDHSMLDRAIAGEIDSRQLFDYYLGWLNDPSVSPHFDPVPESSVPFAREWGMNVAVHDVRRVVKAAGKRGRSVVLGGHSLGGSITTAYASWDFNGKPGAKGLSGLVFIDGGSLGGTPPSAEQASASLQQLQGQSPFLDLVGLGLPWAAGVFNATGSTTALEDPTGESIFGSWPLAPANLVPPVPVTNRAQYGYALDTDTGPASLALVQVHIGGLAASGDPRDWANGELGTVERAAKVFSGIPGMDGTAWYHPRRLSLDSSAVNNGIANPAQQVLGDDAIHGDEVNLPIYAFQTSLGYANGQNRVINAAKQLAKQSGVPNKDLRLVSKPQTYAHIDPLAASADKNAFLLNLVRFLKHQVG